jgi:8-amino-7-oxononanoate synthase
MGSPNTLDASLSAELDDLGAQGLFRSRVHLDGAQGPRVRIEGREYLSFASNDYLGLAAHPGLIEAFRAAAVTQGVGAGASHLLYGHSAAHDTLESALAAFVGLPRTLLFSTGYMANLGVITALCGRNDALFADKLNHASLNDAMVLSRARFTRYPHGDLDALARALRDSGARRKFVVTDAVFSMDGDIAPIPRLVELCDEYDASLIVDDAHGFGVLGPHGEGTLAHCGVRSDRVIYMGTLGKAAGVYGAFIAGSHVLVDYLVNRARTYIYTTATPPALASTLLASLRVIREDDWRRQRLAALIETLRDGLGDRAQRLLPSTTAIQPLVLGDAGRAMAVSQAMRQRGFIVPAVRPPTVPRGTARLRISLSAAHGVDDVRSLASALGELLA